jgi:hypothetical protein
LTQATRPQLYPIEAATKMSTPSSLTRQRSRRASLAGDDSLAATLTLGGDGLSGGFAHTASRANMGGNSGRGWAAAKAAGTFAGAMMGRTPKTAGMGRTPKAADVRKGHSNHFAMSDFAEIAVAREFTVLEDGRLRDAFLLRQPELDTVWGVHRLLVECGIDMPPAALREVLQASGVAFEAASMHLAALLTQEQFLHVVPQLLQSASVPEQPDGDAADVMLKALQQVARESTRVSTKPRSGSADSTATSVTATPQNGALTPRHLTRPLHGGGGGDQSRPNTPQPNLLNPFDLDGHAALELEAPATIALDDLFEVLDAFSIDAMHVDHSMFDRFIVPPKDAAALGGDPSRSSKNLKKPQPKMVHIASVVALLCPDEGEEERRRLAGRRGGRSDAPVTYSGEQLAASRQQTLNGVANARRHKANAFLVDRLTDCGHSQFTIRRSTDRGSLAVSSHPPRRIQRSKSTAMMMRRSFVDHDFNFALSNGLLMEEFPGCDGAGPDTPRVQLSNYDYNVMINSSMALDRDMVEVSATRGELAPERAVAVEQLMRGRDARGNVRKLDLGRAVISNTRQNVVIARSPRPWHRQRMPDHDAEHAARRERDMAAARAAVSQQRARRTKLNVGRMSDTELQLELAELGLDRHGRDATSPGRDGLSSRAATVSPHSALRSLTSSRTESIAVHARAWLADAKMLPVAAIGPVVRPPSAKPMTVTGEAVPPVALPPVRSPSAARRAEVDGRQQQIKRWMTTKATKSALH